MGTSVWLLVPVLVALVSVAMPMELCANDNIRTIERSALQIRTLHTNFENNFTWQATFGTSNLIIQHSGSLDVTVTEEGNDTLAITVGEPLRAKAAGLAPLVTTTLGLMTLLAVFVTCDSKKILLLCITIACLIVSGLAQHDCDQPDLLRLFVPSALIKDFYRDGIRRPVICKLHSTSQYSNIPSNNEVLFQDEFCTLREPEHWQQWLDHFFGANSTQSFYDDFDADGVVNIIEYYGAATFKGSYLTLNETISRKRRALFEHPSGGTDPTKADSNGDLLVDGFDIDYRIRPLDMDYGIDTSDNLNEQSQWTDPLNPDSDGDVGDGKNVADPKSRVDTDEKAR